jgi:hypothetical protein
MQAEDINVTKEEQFFTNQKLVVPTSREVALETLTIICQEFIREKATGLVTVVFNQGGMPMIKVDENARVIPGTEIHEVLERVTTQNSLKSCIDKH